MAAARSASSLVQGRVRRISARTWARPAIPSCRPSRYGPGRDSGSSAAPSTATDVGIHGPSDQRTWASTQRHARSATPAYRPDSETLIPASWHDARPTEW